MGHPRYNSWLKHKDYIMSIVFKSDITIEGIISSAFQFGWNVGSNYSEQKITSDNSDYSKLKDSLEMIADYGGSLTGEDAHEMKQIATEALQ